MSELKIHILFARGYYLGQVRKAGYRKWVTITGKCKTPESAMSKATKQMQGFKRARVLMIDYNPYYEPTIVMECAR
jgi:cell division protein FtsI/penicillin-binding protein 2